MSTAGEEVEDSDIFFAPVEEPPLEVDLDEDAITCKCLATRAFLSSTLMTNCMSSTALREQQEQQWQAEQSRTEPDNPEVVEVPDEEDQ